MTNEMKDWEHFICGNFDCVFYDQDTDICDFCVCNDRNYKDDEQNNECT